MAFIVHSLLVSALLQLAFAIPFPNGIVGEPEVECGEDSIVVVFNTESEFIGKVFVKGHFADPDCISEERGRKTTSIEVSKEKCGVTQIREVNPNGLRVSVPVVISFHDKVLTKVDRGFDIQCFYMEAQKTVTFPVSVSMIELLAFEEVAEMPRCRYEVLDGGPTGEPVAVAKVGQPLYHKWTCESATPVDDGTGTTIEVLDDKGCSVDKYVLQNLEYPTALMAGQEAHAFKFADQVAVNFKCSIRIDIRPDNGQCERPDCPDPGPGRTSSAGGGTRNRVRRPRSEFRPDHVYQRPAVADVDVVAPAIDVLDLPFGNTNELSSDPNFSNAFVSAVSVFLTLAVTGLVVLGVFLGKKR